MKRIKLASLILATVMCTGTFLTGCASEPKKPENKPGIESKDPVKKEEKKAEEVKTALTEKVTEKGKFEFVVESTEFTKKLELNGLPQKAKGKTKTLIHLVTKVKNLGEKSEISKVLTVNGRYEGKYEAESKVVIEGREPEKNEIDKDEEVTVHYLVEVEEAMTTDNTVLELLVSAPKAEKIVVMPIEK